MFNKEPAVFFNSLGEIAKAVIPVLILGGFVHWGDKMVAAVMFLVGVAVTSLSTMFTRNNTVPTTTANQQIATAVRMPSTATVQDVISATAEANK